MQRSWTLEARSGERIELEIAADAGGWRLRLGEEVLAVVGSEQQAQQLASACLRAVGRASEFPADLAALQIRRRDAIVVDDDPIQRLICRELLEQAQYDVREASDGDQVLPLLDKRPVGLVVLDMLMPNMDGLEVIGQLKARHPATRVLAISSGGRIGSTDLLHWAGVLGAHGILSKPFDGPRFLEAVDKLCG